MSVTIVETWRPVVGYEGLYEVSDHGRVRGVDREDGRGRRIAGQVLKPTSKGTAPHLKVELAGVGDRVTKLVHRMVLEAFVGPCPEGMETRHLDGDPSNNALSNLAWGTRGENNRDRVEHGTHHQARKTHCPRGHRLDSPNLVPAETRRGRRACLACSRAQTYAKDHGAPVTQELADAYYERLVEGMPGYWRRGEAAPLARNSDGAVLGVDWRQVLEKVPGAIPARQVIPGDQVAAMDQELAVIAVRSEADVIRLVTWTVGGAEIVLERGADELVDVVATGVFVR